MVLDGTADNVVLTHALPGLEVLEVHPERIAEVYQVWNRTYSFSAIYRPDEGKGRRELKPEKRDGLNAFLGALGEQVALLGPQGLVDDLDHPEALSAHFNGLRGLDRFKHCTAGVVVSRLQPPAYEVERLARALFPYEQMELTGEMVQQPAGYRLRSGARKGVMSWTMPDPLAQRALHQIREAEVTQAIDRLRLIHREKPCPIYVLGNLPLDLTVDYLIRDPLEDYRLWVLLCRAGWTLPLLPAYVLHVGRDLFHDNKAARDWLSRRVRPRLAELHPWLRVVPMERWDAVLEPRMPVRFDVLTAARDDLEMIRHLGDNWGLTAWMVR
jgi:hypothetical protein